MLHFKHVIYGFIEQMIYKVKQRKMIFVTKSYLKRIYKIIIAIFYMYKKTFNGHKYCSEITSSLTLKQ